MAEALSMNGIEARCNRALNHGGGLTVDMSCTAIKLQNRAAALAVTRNQLRADLAHLAGLLEAYSKRISGDTMYLPPAPTLESRFRDTMRKIYCLSATEDLLRQLANSLLPALEAAPDAALRHDNDTGSIEAT